MVKKIAVLAFVGIAMGAAVHAKAKLEATPQQQLIEAKQALEEVLFADDKVLKNLPTFEDVLLGDGVDLDLDGFEDFFNLDDEDDVPVLSMWDMYRELEFGEANEELTMRQRLHIISVMVRDFMQTVTTLVRFEINLMRDNLSERLTTIWDYFSQQAYGDKADLTAKEKMVVATAITRSYANAFKDKMVTRTTAATRSVGRSSASGATRAVAGLRNGAEVLRERGPIWAARAAAQSRKFAGKVQEDSAVAYNYLSEQTKRASKALKRGSVIARNVAVAGYESAREQLREELN